MPKDKRYLKIDMKKSLKALIIERWGHTVGKKLVHCFQDALAKGENKKDVLRLLKRCLAKELEEKEIEEEDLETSLDNMEFYHTI
jgi:hypothetical protein